MKIERLLSAWAGVWARTLIYGSIFLFFLLESAFAGTFELSGSFSYSRSRYSPEESYSWSKRLSGGLGYHFTDSTEFEFTFQDSISRTKIIGYEDVTTHDQVLSGNWVQGLFGSKFPLQPYLKAGVGKLFRRSSGEFEGSGDSSTHYSSLTVVLGAGLRIFFTQEFSIRAEANSYLTGGLIRSWRENVAGNLGLSWYF